MELQIKYDSNKYSDQLVANFLKWWQDILSAFANQSEKQVVTTRLIEQKKFSPSDGIGMMVENLINDSETLVSLFAKQVFESSESIALSGQTFRLTYKELDDRSSQFANFLLQQQTIQRGD